MIRQNVSVAREIFAALPPPEGGFDPSAFLAKVTTGKTIAQYPKGRAVYSQGDDADAVFYLQTGKVKTTVVSMHGKEAVVSILAKGQFFGEGCLAGQLKRTATVTAITECSIIRIEKPAIMRALQQEPRFAEMFIAHLLSRNIRIEADLVDQLFNSTEKRLARALLLLANFGTDGRMVVIPKLSQETLAEMIGTTRERVNFFMNKFKKLGFISCNGKLEVNGSLLNVVLSDQPHHVVKSR